MTMETPIYTCTIYIITYSNTGGIYQPFFVMGDVLGGVMSLFEVSFYGINDDTPSKISYFSVNMLETEPGKLTETNQWDQWG